MKIDEAIENLLNAKSRGVKNIVLAYWESNMFERSDNEEWEKIAYQVEDQMDWSSAHENIALIIQDNKE